jgi:hypothetical protein
MTQTVNYAFTGTNGAAWDGAVFDTITTTSGGIVDIQSNTGRVLAGAVGSYLDLAFAPIKSASTTADFDMSVDVNVGTLGEKYVIIGFRGAGSVSSTWPVYNDSYNLRIDPSASQIGVWRFDAGVEQAVLQTMAWTFTASDVIHSRIRCSGPVIQCKMWKNAETEPDYWWFTVSDATYQSQSRAWIALAGGSVAVAASVNYDNLTFSNVPLYTPGELLQSLGSQVSNTAATTTVISFTGLLKPQIGDLVVVYGSRDDIASDPLTGDSFSDGTANTYTRVVAGSLATVGTALDGIVGVFFYSILTVAWTGTNTLTWTHPSTKAAMQMEHFYGVSSLRASGTNTATSSAGAPSVALTTPVSGDIVLAMEAIEYSTAGTSTGDSDTTNGTWSLISGPTATTGTTLAACKVISQHKKVTGTGTQTYNPTHSVTASVDCVAIIAAFIPSTSSSANLGTATSSFVANNLSRLGQYNLGTTTVGISANGLSRLGQYNLGTAALGISAFGLSVGATPTNANLGTASLGLSAFGISGSRTLNSAALAFVANAIAQTRTFSKADLTIAATALDPLTVGAEPIGQGRTLPSASLGLTGYNFTYGGQVLPGASVALAAALLGSSRAMSAATLGMTAYGLTVASIGATANLGRATLGFTASGLRPGSSDPYSWNSTTTDWNSTTVDWNATGASSTANLGNATLAFTANPITFNDTIAVIAASLGISASALGLTDSIGAGTATLGLTASNLADSGTTTAASLGVAATGLTANSRTLGTTTVPFSAFAITTAGYALASASITAIANNLSLLGSFNLGNATVAFSALNMTNQTTGQATLGKADFSVSAANLSVGLSAGLSASLAMSATNLARAAVVGTSSLSVAALGLSQLRTAALGLASLVTTAYDMSQSAPGSAALGSGTLLLSANPMTRFALLSAGLATVALDANAIQPKVNASGAVGSMSTAAQPMSSTRTLAKGILDLTAYGFGTYRPSTLSTAALTITAYALSAQTGKSKGRISVRNGYVQFKTGGRGLTGPKVANPVSSFKTVGG